MSDELPIFEDTDEAASARVTRGIEQGLGVGQRELDAQLEPAIDPPLLDNEEDASLP